MNIAILVLLEKENNNKLFGFLIFAITKYGEISFRKGVSFVNNKNNRKIESSAMTYTHNSIAASIQFSANINRNKNV